MKLIIDIPDEMYDCIKKDTESEMYIIDVIKKGTPYEPKGKWIRKVDEVGFISHICSECGAEIEVEDPIDDKFCFNCGAQMQKGDAE